MQKVNQKSTCRYRKFFKTNVTTTHFFCPFWLIFDGYRWFSNRIARVWLPTGTIFGISTKSWVDSCVFQIVSATFFWVKFWPLLPLKATKNLFFTKKTILFFSYLCFCLEWYFTSSKLPFYYSNNFLSEIIFFRVLEGE